MGPTLLVLAAGMGSRYGGLKQVDPVGPSGETILDYGVFDAIRAGFEGVVFLIRRGIEAEFRAKVGSRYEGSAEVSYAFQELDDLPGPFRAPEERTKPWGTGHAVWCARGRIGGNFAVINADDFYGADAFGSLAGFLGGAAGGRFALVGYPLRSTLSEHGAVSRGICEVEGGLLKAVRERTGIRAEEVGKEGDLRGDEIVSMNCWGFTPEIFVMLEGSLRTFLAGRIGEAGAEFYLPEAVGSFVAAGAARVEVLPTRGQWFGATYREDRERVRKAIAELVDRGLYPPRLPGSSAR